MSESEDDWEKQLEDDEKLEANLNKPKEKKFAGEDAIDSDEEKEKKKEEEKKAQEKKAQEGEGKKKQKGGKKDYDELFEQRLKGSKGVAAKTDLSKEGMSKGKRDEVIARDAELNIADSLFESSEIASVNPNTLKTQGDYENLGKQVATVLYQGQAPYRIPSFFKELLKDLSTKCDKLEIKDILDQITVIYNNKDKKKGKNEKDSKPVALAGGKFEVNNKKQMVAAVMGGDDDDYGEEEGQYNDDDYYGEEAYDGKIKGGRIKEKEIDFM